MQVTKLKVIQTASSLAQEFKMKIPTQRHKTIKTAAGPIGNHHLWPSPSSLSSELVGDGNLATLWVY